MWLSGGSWQLPLRWAWLAVLVFVTLVSLHPQPNPFDNLKAALLMLKTQVAELQAKIDSLETSLQRANASSVTLGQTIDDLMKLRDEQQQKINALGMSYEEQLRVSKDLETLVQTLQTQLNESQESLRSLKVYLSRREGEMIVTFVGVGLTAVAGGITIGYLLWGQR